MHKGLLSKSFKQTGHRLHGPCPIHQGDNPHAFTVDLEKNLWYCFTQCQKGGDIIELVRLIENVKYNQVANVLNLVINQKEFVHIRTRNKIPVDKFKPYRQMLPLNNHATFLSDKGIRPSTALKFEAGAYHGKGFLYHSVGVRLFDLSGEPIGYAGRRLNKEDIERYGKWKFPRHFPKNEILYHWHPVENESLVVITECPWSVMRLDQLNIPAISLLGTHISEAQCKILTKINHIVLMMDGDSAGLSATEKIMKQLQPLTKVSKIRLWDNKDPDDLDDSCLINLVNQFSL
jgi:DNA primase